MQLHLTLAALMLVEGPVTTVVAGSLVGSGVLALLPVWLLAVSADLVADSLLFALGRCGRSPRLAPLLARLGLHGARAERLGDRVVRHLPRVVVGAKVVDLGAVPAFLAAGLAGVRYRRFLGWIALTSAVRAAVLVAVGVLAGQHAAALADTPEALAALSAALGAVLFTVSLVAKKHVTHRTGGAHP